jgi:hypothetical protein
MTNNDNNTNNDKNIKNKNINNKCVIVKRLHYCDQPHDHWYEHIFHKYYLGSKHQSKHMIDDFTLTHIFWPILFYYLLKVINIHCPEMIVLICTSFFEIYENMEHQIVKYHRIEIDSSGESTYRGDSTINIIGDLMSHVISIYVAIYLFNTKNNHLNILLTLLILFCTITKLVGISYWTEFMEFMIVDLINVFKI